MTAARADDQPFSPMLRELRLLTVTETCHVLQISRWTFYRLLQTNQLRTMQIGRSRRISQQAVIDYLHRLDEGEGLS